MDDRQSRRLLDLLFFRFETEGTSLFAVLDGARDPRVVKALRVSGLEHECLFSGRLNPALAEAAPYIVKLALGAPSCQRLIDDSWGAAWGIFLAARTSLAEVRRHLRTFLRVQDESHKKLFFRYYDPRVLRMFLPTCDNDQLRQIFGPIQRFDMEAPDSSRLQRFRLIPEPGAPPVLRSWTYDLSSEADLMDDRGSALAGGAGAFLAEGIPTAGGLG